MARIYSDDFADRYDRGVEEFEFRLPDIVQTPGLAPAPVSSAVTGQVSPDAFTADQNDFTLGDGHSFRLSTDGVARTITGFANVKAGRIVYIHNVAGGANISLANESASSVAQNRIITGTGGTVAIQPARSAILLYDGETTRWRLIAFT